MLNGVGDTFVHSCTCVVGSYIYINIIYVYSQFKRILLINPPRASPYFTVNIVGDEWGVRWGCTRQSNIATRVFIHPTPPCTVFAATVCRSEIRAIVLVMLYKTYSLLHYVTKFKRRNEFYSANLIILLLSHRRKRRHLLFLVDSFAIFQHKLYI